MRKTDLSPMEYTSIEIRKKFVMETIEKDRLLWSELSSLVANRLRLKLSKI